MNVRGCEGGNGSTATTAQDTGHPGRDLSADRGVGDRRYADARVRRTADLAARTLGFPDIGTLVRDCIARGAGLAAISREAGLHKDWRCRHLATVDPAAARSTAGP